MKNNLQTVAVVTFAATMCSSGCMVCAGANTLQRGQFWSPSCYVWWLDPSVSPQIQWHGMKTWIACICMILKYFHSAFLGAL